ncbi:MAG: formate dehydrogenase subunit delta [Alcaligenaceae bacterium]|uniref:Formate dehydrogenase subunit delta n=1 Tax=Paenalcaligenes hermetiae TaxID=1157987 RepID=A0ABP9M558_9BURK|nr:formate dehydrogenase subunit delta [Paenalcaligenes sp.]NLJ61900.1 formate dehydrogenase subunit delta [Alcaligenaceae bacterium]
MQVDPLIPMINRIGEFFQAQPDQQAAQKEIADHVRLFWEPRMRQSILDFLTQHPDGQAGTLRLHPLVVAALHAHKESLLPKLSV